MTPETAPQPIHLKDYTPPDYLIDEVALHFDLGEEFTRVHSRLSVRRNPERGKDAPPLVLDGQDLVLEGIALDGESLATDRYTVDDERLTVREVPARFSLDVQTRIEPQNNTSLEGLYKSSGVFCTQCEAEGFRRITYFIDRPDVMARYTTTIVADRDRYPVLLSNGNPIEQGQAEGNRHWVKWEDPFRKPSYLFALVAGDLACVHDTFVTHSGREIRLRIFVQKHNADKCEHAMQALKKAMQWDEQVFGLECDLDVYMIVAVDDFNMGAMENKGLNVFNSKYVLARPDTATDTDYVNIESVIAHEYFHNWTGNRVTCRDWFQLSLKEGLTVFREQEFSADTFSRGLRRIQEVRLLRTHQFPEDAGPMAHPVRPASYIEISNFYTPTVYNKGAEVIRMIHTLLGGEGFRKGMDLYFQRHDGQAVTTDDFVQAMHDASGVDLTQFRLWYEQAGTPELTVRGRYDAREKTYTLAVKQYCPPTPGQPRKKPFHVPLAMGLVDPDGGDVPLRLDGEPSSAARQTRVLSLRDESAEFRFVDVPRPPVPSLLRDFSAPVKLRVERPETELAFLLAHDSDPFNRWDAGQTYATGLMLRLIAEHQAGRPLAPDANFTRAVGRTLTGGETDRALVAEALTLPTETWLAEQMKVVDVEAIHHVRRFVRRNLARDLREEWLRAYTECPSLGPYRFGPEEAGRRSLKNLALAHLAELEEPEMTTRCVDQFRSADNMTDSMAALAVLAQHECPEREEALAAFHEHWKDDALVLDKWFTIQATSRLPDTLQRVRALMEHPAFHLKNPNKVRALIGAFCHANPVRFHDASGEGYRFLAERVLELDPLNPQIAARLLGALNRWRRYDEHRQGLMKAELERILAAPGLSRDTYEIASKALS
ncbi:MAG: aminopeptidase N [Gammaproteobacteria bacterium]|nr:aminopeptidase N [Gammaproteobacteria bacterium]NIR83644.1 aminopeptidase N [Gammaproteobacteria bacterium]NIR91617.1 aminopeptidase N [Gammaproteobacteria bacterium]NIU04806.1 aminopeptidase N [Gammaproteobacteria bacterium]NIV53156.1 aminopeptidase N [Gammaproteobacteria bacterium]